MTSPSSAGPGSVSIPGLSSKVSIGKAITSVGPSRSIHCLCRVAIAAVSTTRIDSSTIGFTPSSSSTCRATPATASSSTATPDSLLISMLTASCHPQLDSTADSDAVVVPGVGLDNVADQLVANHVLGVQVG